MSTPSWSCPSCFPEECGCDDRPMTAVERMLAGALPAICEDCCQPVISTPAGERCGCCEGCQHPLKDHNEHGHCEDECSCALCDPDTCGSSSCIDRRAAGREWKAAKDHDRDTCPCGPCAYLRGLE